MTSSHGQCTLTGYTAFAPGGGLISNVGGNSLSGKYTVSSDLYIDKDFTFDQCELRFDAGVRVVVQAGFQLTITGQSLLTSCGSSNNAMWQGIEVDGSINSVASVDINGSSVIEDAEMGINLYSGYSEIYADNAIFNRNYVHVFYDVDNVYSLPLNSYIINSSFFCKDAPSPGGTDCNCLISPHQNQRTSTCIFLNHCNASQSGASFTIGYTPSLNSQPNYFANADTGISSMMFNTLIRYNYFNTLTFGIYQRHNSWADASENVFEDCVNAIRFDDIHATDVLDNTFEFGSSGIWITRSSGNIHLSGNSINGYWQGIRIHNSLNAGNIYTTEISLNTIAYAGIRHVNYAIRVEEGALINSHIIVFT